MVNRFFQGREQRTVKHVSIFHIHCNFDSFKINISFCCIDSSLSDPLVVIAADALMSSFSSPSPLPRPALYFSSSAEITVITVEVDVLGSIFQDVVEMSEKITTFKKKLLNSNSIEDIAFKLEGFLHVQKCSMSIALFQITNITNLYT